MSRNYLRSWEFREQVSRDLYPDAADDGCAAGCPLETSADSCLALVCPHRRGDPTREAGGRTFSSNGSQRDR